MELMDHTDDAQRDLERKALRNVRALVDRAEAEDRDRSVNAVTFAIRFVPVLILAGLVLVGTLVAYSAWRARQAPPPPANASEYVDQLFAKIEKRTTRGQRRDVENFDGRVDLSFEVKPNGYVDNLRITRPSHDSVMDGESTRLVKGAEPYGRLPPGGAGAPLNVDATLLFGSQAGGKGSFRITHRKESP
jgi:TonB family protein